VANDERATDLIFRSMRNTARVAKNAVSQKVIEMERSGATFDQVRELVKGTRGRQGLESGDTDFGIWSAGMVQGLIHDVPSVKALIDRIMSDAESIIGERLAGMCAR
jgi:NAD(P)H-dependent flavin oxidoreductase YrpB (nitropropane dioxygenase family)